MSLDALVAKLATAAALKAADPKDLVGSNPTKGIILIRGPYGPYKEGYLICQVMYPTGEYVMITVNLTRGTASVKEIKK